MEINRRGCCNPVALGQNIRSLCPSLFKSITSQDKLPKTSKSSTLIPLDFENEAKTEGGSLAKSCVLLNNKSIYPSWLRSYRRIERMSPFLLMYKFCPEASSSPFEKSEKELSTHDCALKESQKTTEPSINNKQRL